MGVDSMMRVLRKVSLLASVVLLCACSAEPQDTIFVARQIVTMESEATEHNAIFVSGGRIQELGMLDQLQSQYPMAAVDTQFNDSVIIPGLIDPHVHMVLGALIYSRPFAPPWDMETPDGLVKGLPDKASFLERIKQLHVEDNNDDPLIVYGYHNLVHGDLDRHDLDTVSPTRPIVIWHYSGHDLYLNSGAIEWTEISPKDGEHVEGFALDDEGQLTGRVYEHAALELFQKLAMQLLTPSNVGKGWSGFETMLLKAGVTSVAELGYGLFGKNIEDIYYWLEYTKDDTYDLYMVPEHRAFYKKYGDQSVAKVLALAAKEAGRGDPVVLPQIKFFVDAAFYSQTMKMREPGYTGGQSAGTDGVWATPPEKIEQQILPYWNAGIDVRIHSNGDAAQDVTLKVLESLSAAREQTPRYVLEHAGILRPEHLNKIAQYNAGISAASHYVHYMGEDYQSAIGDRVRFMTPLNSASSQGIPITLHSDAPLAPPYPLQAASVHMLRSTRQGGVSTESERLNAFDALASVTINAAWAMGLGDKIGSIKPGKLANFTVLSENPLQTPAERWPSIEVNGIVLRGQPNPVSE